MLTVRSYHSQHEHTRCKDSAGTVHWQHCEWVLVLKAANAHSPHATHLVGIKPLPQLRNLPSCCGSIRLQLDCCGCLALLQLLQRLLQPAYAWQRLAVQLACKRFGILQHNWITTYIDQTWVQLYMLCNSPIAG